MNKILPLMQREWLQHRFGWLMTLGIPLALAALAVSFGQVQIGNEESESAGEALPALMAMASIAGTTTILFMIVAMSSLVIVSGLARRDHADRSIEFWLSVPVSHSASLASPMLVHLLLVPAAALLVGLLGGYVMSFLLVGRMIGVADWFGLPWGAILAGTVSVALRLLVGLPLALLWLSPLILLVVLLTAWFKRWGWVMLTVGLGLGGWLMKMLFGQPWLNRISADLLQHAGKSLIHGGGGLHIANSGQAFDALGQIPAWAVEDLGASLRDLATPLLPGALLFAAGCFYLLVQWRKRGAGAAG